MVYANLALALAHAGFLLTSIVRAAVLTLRSTMRRVRADSSNRVAGEVETAAANGEENDEVGENEGEAVEVQEEGSDQAADKEEKATGVKSGNGTGKAKAVAKQLFGGPIVSS